MYISKNSTTPKIGPVEEDLGVAKRQFMYGNRDMEVDMSSFSCLIRYYHYLGRLLLRH